MQPIVIAAIAVVGGAGFWTWRTKKVELNAAKESEVIARFAAIEQRYQSDLMDRLNKLLVKIDELNDVKLKLASEVAELRTQLKAANTKINELKELLK